MGLFDVPDAAMRAATKIQQAAKRMEDDLSFQHLVLIIRNEHVDLYGKIERLQEELRIARNEPPVCDCSADCCSITPIVPTTYTLVISNLTGEPCEDCKLIAASLRQIAERLEQ